jgi:hypothetical protein
MFKDIEPASDSETLLRDIYSVFENELDKEKLKTTEPFTEQTSKTLGNGI